MLIQFSRRNPRAIQHEVCVIRALCAAIHTDMHSHRCVYVCVEAKDNRKHHNYAVCVVLYRQIYCAVFYFILFFLSPMLLLLLLPLLLLFLFHNIYLFGRNSVCAVWLFLL